MVWVASTFTSGMYDVRVHAGIVSVNTFSLLIVFVVVCCCCLSTFSLGHQVAAAVVVQPTTAAAGPLPLPPCRLCGPTGCTRVPDFVEFLLGLIPSLCATLTFCRLQLQM